jgi:hypothetical protein
VTDDRDFRALHGSIVLRDRLNNTNPSTEFEERLRYILSTTLLVRLAKRARK